MEEQQKAYRQSMEEQRKAHQEQIEKLIESNNRKCSYACNQLKIINVVKDIDGQCI